MLMLRAAGAEIGAGGGRVEAGFGVDQERAGRGDAVAGQHARDPRVVSGGARAERDGDAFEHARFALDVHDLLVTRVDHRLFGHGEHALVRDAVHPGQVLVGLVVKFFETTGATHEHQSPVVDDLDWCAHAAQLKAGDGADLLPIDERLNLLGGEGRGRGGRAGGGGAGGWAGGPPPPALWGGGGGGRGAPPTTWDPATTSE